MLIKVKRIFDKLDMVEDEAIVSEIEEMAAFLEDGEVPGGGDKDAEKDKDDGKKKSEEDLKDDKSEEDEEDKTEEDDEESESEEDEDEEESDKEDSDDDEEEEDEDADKEDEKDESAEVKALKEQVTNLMGVVDKLLKKDEKKEEDVKVEDEVDIFETEEFTNFVDEMDYDEKETKAFKKLFTAFEKTVHNKTVNQLLAATPELVSKTISSQSKIEKVKNDFYDKHPALKPAKKYVAAIAREIAKEEGKGFDMEKVLAKAAKKAYKALGIDVESLNKEKDKQKKGSKAGKAKKKPAFAKAKGTRKKVKKKSASVENEIEEMNKLLD